MTALLYYPSIGPLELGAQEQGPPRDAMVTAAGWVDFGVGLRLHSECHERFNYCYLLPGGSVQVDLGSRLALQASAHLLWALEELGTFQLYSGRAKLYVSGAPDEERLFVYGMYGLQPWHRSNTFRIRALGIGWEWVASARTTGAFDVGLLQSTSFLAGYQLVFGLDIHARLGT